MKFLLILLGLFSTFFVNAYELSLSDLQSRKIQLGHYEIYPIIAPEAKGFVSVFKQEMIDNLGVELVINGSSYNFVYNIFGEKAKNDPDFYKKVDDILKNYLPIINDALAKNKVKKLENIIYTNKHKLACKNNSYDFNLLEKKANIQHELYGEVESLISQEIMINGISVLNIEMLKQKRKYQDSELAIVGSTESCNKTFFVIVKNSYYGVEKSLNHEYKLVYFDLPKK